MVYYRMYSESEERTYFICEDCEPLNEDDEVIDILPDDLGIYECERCGLHWDDDENDWVID